MKKSNKLNNVLIKRKNIVLLLNKNGIKRINKEALDFFEIIFRDEALRIAGSLKEELLIKGKKTLEKKDIEEVISRLKKQESFEM
jgi:histone H3/H4